jgi:hypothetical protein
VGEGAQEKSRKNVRGPESGVVGIRKADRRSHFGPSASPHQKNLNLNLNSIVITNCLGSADEIRITFEKLIR